MAELKTELKTGEQIAERYKGYSEGGDILGFARDALVEFVPWEHSDGIRADGVSEDEWRAAVKPLNEESVKAVLVDYLAFAIGKAEDHRGISAGRSVQKLAEWCWILGDDEAVAFAEDDANYAQYGAPILKFIAERYGAEVPDDEGFKRMAEGQPCEPNCVEGCGS